MGINISSKKGKIGNKFKLVVLLTVSVYQIGKIGNKWAEIFLLIQG